MSALLKSVDHLLSVEGGYVNHEHDRGGETIAGISRKFWPHWEGWPLVDELKPKVAITGPLKGQIIAFYRKHFWDRVRGDDMPELIAYELFEQAVNMGVGRAIEHLQEALNLLNRNGHSWLDIAVDGRMGPVTLGTLKKAAPQDLLKVMNALQAEHYLNLARRQPTQEHFLRGWLNRAG